MDKKEFSIACYLIKKALLANGQNVIPSVLPPNLLIEPISSIPLSSSVPPMFPVSFPPSPPTYSLQNAATVPQPILFPATPTGRPHSAILPQSQSTIPPLTSLPLMPSANPIPQVNPALIPGAIATPIANLNNL